MSARMPAMAPASGRPSRILGRGNGPRDAARSGQSPAGSGDRLLFLHVRTAAAGPGVRQPAFELLARRGGTRLTTPVTIGIDQALDLGADLFPSLLHALGK